jgi:hypothetical protein
MASEFPKDVGQPPVGGGGMIGRVQRLILKPKEEWTAIDTEPGTAREIFMRWAVPLAAIGPVCSFIGGQVFGIGAYLVHFRPPLIPSLILALVTYGMALAGTWILALIIDALAPSFASVKNFNQAMKVAAYSYTAAWICGILQLIPAVGIIGGLLGLYSFYLLWVGLPILMKTPADKAPGYVIVTIVVAFVVYLIIGFVVGLISASLFTAAALSSPATINVGGTTIDTGKLDETAARLQAASKSMEASVKGGDGAVKAVDPNALQNMLPASISGWNRTSIESQGGGAAGINGSNARAEFQAGDQSFSLSVTDTGVLGNIATLGGAVNVTSNKQTATGYEKSEMQGGNMVSEKWDSQSKSGSYSVLVASRFAVEADGSAPSIDVLKSAVASVNLGQLQSLAK